MRELLSNLHSAMGSMTPALQTRQSSLSNRSRNSAAKARMDPVSARSSFIHSCANETRVLDQTGMKCKTTRTCAISFYQHAAGRLQLCCQVTGRHPGLLDISTRQDDGGALLVERAARLQAQPGVGSRHYVHLLLQVGHVQLLPCSVSASLLAALCTRRYVTQTSGLPWSTDMKMVSDAS